MRPIRLEIEGFTTFREPTTVDFEGAELFALWGPTGAGKSSIIDAIVFALYGTIPRLDDRRAVAGVMSQGKMATKVRLDFAVGRETYCAVRIVTRTKTGATTREARLERPREGQEPEILAGTADELTGAVEQLLGLSLVHFTRCVVLPQGEFARFLLDKPGERQKLLSELLDLGIYDRMGNLARERATAAKASLDVREARLDKLAFATEEARREAEKSVGRFAQLTERLAVAQRSDASLEASLSSTRMRAQDLDGAVTRLRDISVPEGAATISRTAAAAQKAMQDSRREEIEAYEALGVAEKACTTLPPRAELERTIAAYTALGRERDRVPGGEAALDEADKTLAAAAREHKAAVDAFDAACAAREHARQRHLAHAVAAQLRVGEPCPVCENEVTAIPDRPAPEALAATDSQVDAAEKVRAGAERTLREAERNRDRISDKHEALRQQIATMAGELADAPDQRDCTRLLAEVDEASAATAEAKRAHETARATRTRAEAAVAEATGAVRELQEQFDASRDSVASLGPPPPDRTDVAAGWAELERWSRDKAGELTAELADLATEITSAEARRRGLLADALEAAAAAGIDAPDLAAAHRKGVDRLAGAKAEIGRIEEAIEEAARLRVETAGLREQHDVAHALGLHLQTNRFVQWLLDEALRRLVAGANGLLSELSSGAYSLAVDSKGSGFDVIDHRNADEARSARTLSGGETFLASLALALALGDHIAEMATEGSARLESLFLDEGFGTLDPDTLDVVAGAIEELGARGRVVGLVTHVRELAERVPVRFEVVKGPCGSTVARVDA